MRFASWKATVSVVTSTFFATGCAAQQLPPREPSGTSAGGVTEEQPADRNAEPARAQATDGTSTGYTPHDSRRERRTLGWIGIAVGAEATAVAVVTSFMLLHQKNVLDGHCNAQKECDSDGLNAKAVIDETVPWNTASWIVAAAGLAGGTILLLTSRPDSDSGAALTLSPTPAGASLGLRSRF